MSKDYESTHFGHAKGGATKIQTVDWWTPPEVFEKLDLEFDLDVSAPEGGVPWLPAKKYFTKKDDGLEQDWGENLVWMNPPYGISTGSWLDKFVGHGNGIALVFARTDTRWFHNYALKADALCFTKGRLKFINPDRTDTSTPAVGSLFIAIGTTSYYALQKANLGWFVKL